MKMREMIAHETMKILIDTNVMNTVQNTCTTSSPVVILSQLNEFPYSIYGTLTVEIPEKGVKHVATVKTPCPEPENKFKKRQTSKEKRSVLDIDFGDTLDESQFNFLELGPNQIPKA